MPPLILETPFGFNLDLSFWQTISYLPPAEFNAAVIAIIGWVVLWLIFFYMGTELWVKYRQGLYMKNWKRVILAVDVPALFAQTPKAVEQIFAQLSGGLSSINIGQKYWRGKKQKWFSFEIISLEGYIQFVIRTEAEYRDLVEAAIYAQYSSAEITEVEDYVNVIPTRYPNDEWDVFGVEFGLMQDQAYPIRTHLQFQQSVNIEKELVFTDPMAAVLENFTRIGHGENFWFQIVLEPTNNEWKKKGIEMVKKIIAGKKETKPTGVFGLLSGLPVALLDLTNKIWSWNFEVEEKEKEQVGKVSDLTPGMRDVVKAVETKISKTGFKCKIRALYAARKEVYNHARCIEGLIGALSQFHDLNSNGLEAYKATLAHYAFKEYRLGLIKTKFVDAFKSRKLKSGGNPYVLNIEELATLWHFPMPAVKTPLVQKAQIKRGEPPTNLPREALQLPGMAEMPPEPAPPEELPYG